LESLRPSYAWAQQVSKDDGRIKTERLTVEARGGVLAGDFFAEGRDRPGLIVKF
jgi:hypothetical protein